MRTIIAGSRTVTTYQVLLDALRFVEWNITEIISGAALGADKLGERYAHECKIPLRRFPAQWGKYGKRAGYLRNVEMAKNADACIVLWDGVSRGSEIMIVEAQRRNLMVLVYKPDSTGEWQPHWR